MTETMNLKTFSKLKQYFDCLGVAKHLLKARRVNSRKGELK